MSPQPAGTPRRAHPHDRRALIRYSHIFASAVRDVLESADGATPAQLRLLRFLTLDSHHHIHDVADFLGVTPPAATRIVDKLERQGLAYRIPCEGDRRVTFVAVSRRGRRLLGHFTAIERRRVLEVLDGFDREEVHALATLLERYSLALLRSIPGDGVCRRCATHFDAACPVDSIHHNCPYGRASRNAPEGAGEVPHDG